MSHSEDNVTVPLREYLDVRFNSIEARLNSMDTAVNLANANMEKRLEGMNEFRASMQEQASKYVTRTEAIATMVAVATVIFGAVHLISGALH
jgi:hypothetical protein